MKTITITNHEFQTIIECNKILYKFIHGEPQFLIELDTIIKTFNEIINRNIDS
jgi:hypothetical protein